MTADALRLTDADIDRALAEGELSLRYEPVFVLEPRRTLRHHAVVVWQHSRHGEIPRSTLHAAFDAYPREGFLTRFALQRMAHDYRHTKGTSGGLSWALTPRDVKTPRTVEVIEEALLSANISPRKLMVECPPVYSSDAPLKETECLTRLATLGVRLGLRGSVGIEEALAEEASFYSEILISAGGILRLARDLSGAGRLDRLSAFLRSAREEGRILTTATGIADESALRMLTDIGFQAGEGSALAAATPMPTKPVFVNTVPEASGSDGDKVTTMAPSSLDAAKTRALRRFQQGHKAPPLPPAAGPAVAPTEARALQAHLARSLESLGGSVQQPALAQQKRAADTPQPDYSGSIRLDQPVMPLAARPAVALQPALSPERETIADLIGDLPAEIISRQTDVQRGTPQKADAPLAAPRRDRQGRRGLSQFWPEPLRRAWDRVRS